MIKNSLPAIIKFPSISLRKLFAILFDILRSEKNKKFASNWASLSSETQLNDSDTEEKIN